MFSRLDLTDTEPRWMGAVYEVLKDVLVQKEKAENVLIKYYTNCILDLCFSETSKSSDAYLCSIYR